MRTLILVVLATVAAGCGGTQPQTADCKKWVTCSDANGANIDTTYGPMGSCWVDSNTAMHCASACTAALMMFKGADGGLCQ
jgi:hypothetical protein